ncbi:MAG: ADP-ribosylglycohydrolase family protein [Chloroflexota bacterium]
MTTLPNDYRERVYAGWLGKCIGVRLGAPVESWTYDDIANNLGEVNDFLPLPPGKIFKPDDDTAAPMIFIRALEDFGPNVTAEQIGETLLNYLGDQRGTFWWGGYGVSTEHTGYLNLANGIAAPRSGSIAQNGKIIAEQIGGQIFSDIWGLVAPNDPERAADLAARASSVTHDGEGIFGGRFIAALVSQAFSTRDPVALVETGLRVIPAESEYARVTRAVLDFYRAHSDNWRAGFQFVKQNFGYDRYPGVVHIIPNAGVVVLSLLYGGGDLARTVRIATNAGWDTDCNAGNVGAIVGVAVGLDGIDARWRAAMNDALVGASVSGAHNWMTIPGCADLFCRLGEQIAGRATDAQPRLHFKYPGATQGFLAEARGAEVLDLRQVAPGALQATVRDLRKKGEARVFVKTYVRPAELSANSYGASFSPQIYPGQTLTARVGLPAHAPRGLLAAPFAWDDNQRVVHQAVGTELLPGEWQTLAFKIPHLENALLSQVGIVLRTLGDPWSGPFWIESLAWSGAVNFANDFKLERAEYGAISQWTFLRGYWRIEDGAYHGSGAAISETYTGDPAWRDLSLEVDLAPIVGGDHRVLVRVQGARRSYAIGLAANNRLVIYKNAGGYRPVAETRYEWSCGARYRLKVEAVGATITATISDRKLLTWQDTDEPYLYGQIGFSNFASHTRYERFEVAQIF